MNIEEIIPILEQEVADYQVPVVDLIALQTKDPYKVLVSAMLSARTKDQVTVGAVERLFGRAPDIEALSRLPEDEIASLIYPVGFFRSKARYLSQLKPALQPFGGMVPDTVDALVTLPGVGRKTANLVVSQAFQKQAICVDTHVHRIMNIWGYVTTSTPLQTEMALRKKLPAPYWRRINSLLVAFGQGTCKPVGPHCDRCVLAPSCPRINVRPRKPAMVPKMMQQTANFISWNINGLRAIEKKGFIDIVTGLDPEIFAIQEIKAVPEQLSDTIRNIPGYTAFWFAAIRKGYSGVCTYSKKEPLDVLYGLGQEEFDAEGRVLTLEFGNYFLVNCYFPNAQHGLKRLAYKLAFNQSLHNFVDRLAEKKSVVICGDMNVAHKPIDLANPQANEKNPGYSAEERAWMDLFIDSGGFVDCFRKFNQEPEHYTWWSYRFNARARNIGWRIDYFCVDAASEKRVVGCDILDSIAGSDHCPVRMGFL